MKYNLSTDVVKHQQYQSQLNEVCWGYTYSVDYLGSRYIRFKYTNRYIINENNYLGK
jgi:hypothetical protein